MSKDYIVADKMTKVWKTKEVSISFSLAKGETMSLLGPSGSGKSTILKMISGLIKIDSGHLYFNSKDVSSVPPGKRGVGMVFQDYALFPHLSVEDNVAYGLFASGTSKKKARKEVSEWLDLFELSHIKTSMPSNISGGEKQRVSLARSLVLGYELILFDEPLSALDVPLRAKLREFLIDNQKKMGYTAIYVTHDEAEASTLAGKVLYIQ